MRFNTCIRARPLQDIELASSFPFTRDRVGFCSYGDFHEHPQQLIHDSEPQVLSDLPELEPDRIFQALNVKREQANVRLGHLTVYSP